MKALICGAGIAGLALAARLEHHGWNVTVIDRADGPRQQGYMMDFYGLGFEAVRAMGLERQLRMHASRVGEFRYVDSNGRTSISLDYEVFVKALDGDVVGIMRPALERMLRHTLGDGVQVRYGTTIRRLEDTTAELSDGTMLEADVMVGADGIHSHIRSLTFGPERDYLHYLGMHTSAFTFHDPELFEKVHDQFMLTETLDRQLGLYGLQDGDVAAFTVHRSPDETPPGDAREALRREFSGMGDVVDRALAHCPPSAQMYYDAVAQIRMPQWTRGRIALVGDAAHAVSLVAGQGASLGVAGAYVLAEMLATHSSVPHALAEYQRRWRPVATGIQDASRERAIEVFLPRSPRTLLLRRWVLRAMRIPGLPHLMVGSLFPKSRQTITELSAPARR